MCTHSHRPLKTCQRQKLKPCVARRICVGSAQRGGGTILFYEDFANGFEGNNGIGAWTSEDTGEGLIWQL